jgi:hypothetical protein
MTITHHRWPISLDAPACRHGSGQRFRYRIMLSFHHHTTEFNKIKDL